MRCKKRTCSEDHLTRHGLPACVGHKKSTGKPCRASPVHGATVCSKHGAQAGQVKRKAAERVATQKLAATYGDLLAEYRRPGQHPFEVLQEVTEDMAAMTRLVQQRLADLSTSAPDDDTRAAMGLYRDFARTVAHVAKTVLDANVQERLIQLQELQLDALEDAVRATLRDMGLTPMQVEQSRVVFANHLRARHLATEQQPALPA